MAESCINVLEHLQGQRGRRRPLCRISSQWSVQDQKLSLLVTLISPDQQTTAEYWPIVESLTKGAYSVLFWCWCLS